MERRRVIEDALKLHMHFGSFFGWSVFWVINWKLVVPILSNPVGIFPLVLWNTNQPCQLLILLKTISRREIFEKLSRSGSGKSRQKVYWAEGKLVEALSCGFPFATGAETFWRRASNLFEILKFVIGV